MSRDTETLLREAMSAHTRDVRADASFVQAALEHSAASLRTARRRRVRLTAGLAVAGVTLAAWQLATATDRADAPPPPMPNEVVSVQAAYAWAWSLRRGSDAQLAYVEGETLVVGDHLLGLGKGRYVRLIDALPGGWLAIEGGAERFGPPHDLAFGYLSRDGRFAPYRYQSRAGAWTGAAASPSGDLVAYGGAIVKTCMGGGFCGTSRETGMQVRELPATASVVEWSAGGLIYRDARDRSWLLSPDAAASIRQPWERVVAGGYGYTRQGDCVSLSPPHLPGLVAAASTLCGEGQPLAVSKGLGARFAAMSSGRVVSLDGDVVLDAIPWYVPLEQLQLQWETDDSLIVVVHDATAPTHRAVLVRCIVSAGRCERASDPLVGYPELAPLPAG